MSGIERIAKERTRQIDEEGWTDDHDDEQYGGEISGAAAAYAAHASRQVAYEAELLSDPPPSNLWRWSSEWWKPSPDPIRNLEKAGALIAAEIDRLERERA